MRFLVLTFKDDLQNHLVAELYKDQVMNEFMRETEEVAAKRKAFREMRNLLHRANEIVNEVSAPRALSCLFLSLPFRYGSTHQRHGN